MSFVRPQPGRSAISDLATCKRCVRECVEQRISFNFAKFLGTQRSNGERKREKCSFSTPQDFLQDSFFLFFFSHWRYISKHPFRGKFYLINTVYVACTYYVFRVIFLEKNVLEFNLSVEKEQNFREKIQGERPFFLFLFFFFFLFLLLHLLIVVGSCEVNHQWYDGTRARDTRRVRKMTAKGSDFLWRLGIVTVASRNQKEKKTKRTHDE